VAIIQELKDHIAKGSPESRSVLTKAANKMSEAQQRDFLASLQMGDIEFQTEVAPYMPSGSEIDPSRARLKAFPKEAGIGPRGLTSMGISTKGVTNPELLKERFEGYEIQYEPDTVTALEAANANPRVFSHEYRHFEGTDADMELLNRVQDVMASQNKKDLTKNTRLLAAYAYRMAMANRFREDDGDDEAEKLDAEPYRKAYNTTIDGTEDDIAKTAQDLLASPLVSKFMRFRSFQRMLPRAAVGPYFKKNVEMPEGYRAGGRTRLI
tara:strand:+ start:661 stop:1461 length:801 start_codon:yes stop_codon:yes gene_type:complete